MSMIPVNRKFLRGDIYYANLEPHLGSEQGGIRPVVVVQNNTANCYSPNLIVAPVTSNTAKKPDHQAHVLVDGNRAFLQPSMILAESVQTISKGRLIRPMGRLSMPSLGMLTINALAAADATLIPVQAQYLSAKGLEQLLQTVQKVRRQINPKLKIEGILLTMTDSRTNYGKQISNLIRQAYGKHLKVFEQTIPRSVRAAETSAAGKSIFAYDSKGKVAEAYKSLAKEVQADADRQRKLSSERAR